MLLWSREQKSQTLDSHHICLSHFECHPAAPWAGCWCPCRPTDGHCHAQSKPLNCKTSALLNHSVAHQHQRNKACCSRRRTRKCPSSAPAFTDILYCAFIADCALLGFLWVGGAGMPADESTGKTVMYTVPLLYCTLRDVALLFLRRFSDVTLRQSTMSRCIPLSCDPAGKSFSS